MKTRIALLAMAVAGGALAAQSWGQTPGWNGDSGALRWQAQMTSPGGMGMSGNAMGSMQRHRQVMRHGIPEPYASLPAPVGTTHQIARGAALYQTHCASCHGAQGRGDGPAATSLSPPPADL